MQVKNSIFRSYDIRGIYPDELDEVAAEAIGKAFGTVLVAKGANECVIGMDNRESSPALSQSFIKGLNSTGINSVNTGVTLTPIIHFLTHIPGFGGGVNITASHNPKKYNGIKLDLEKAVTIHGEGLQKLYEDVIRGDFKTGKGLNVEKDLIGFYIDYLKKQFKFDGKLKIVLDCGNGATSLIAPKVLEALGCVLIPVDCSLNSDFPHGVPDPENRAFMKELQNKVLEYQADIGFAFDTDGDRVGVVDGNGNFHENDRIILLLAADVLRRYPGSTIVYDVKSSGVVEGFITKHGGVAKISATGRSNLLEEMRNGAVLGSELSGHTYFGKDYLGFDDGIYAVCRILEIITRSGKSLAELMSVFPKRVSTPEIKVDCSDEEKFIVIENVKEEVSKTYPNVITIDGVRVQVTDTGWFLVRASNTSAYLSIRLEGKDQKEVDYLFSIVDNLLNKVKKLHLTLSNTVSAS